MIDDQGPSLDGRVVVVAGGTGFVGGFVVRALIGAGARVIVPTRRGTAIGPGSQRPVPEGVLVVPIPSWADPAEIGAAAQHHGWQPDAAVVSLGGWWLGGRLVDLSPSEWDGLLGDHLTSHFLAARALVPLISGGRDPVYMTLNGAASREPMARSGPVSIAGAGQRMLLDVLRREDGGVRFHEVCVRTAVAGDDRNLDPATEVTGDQVADAVLRVLAEPTCPHEVDVG